MTRGIGLVLGFLAWSSFGALPRYASCPEVLEFEGMAVRLMEVADLDAVEAFLPHRTPETHWRQTYATLRARGLKPGIVVRGRTDDNIDTMVAAMVWRPTADGIELLELHVASHRYRALGLEAWLLGRLQRRIGEGKVIRMVIPDLDTRRARELQALGFVQTGVDPTAFNMVGYLDGLVFTYRPEMPEEPETTTPPTTTESEPETDPGPTTSENNVNLQPGQGEELGAFVEAHRGAEAKDEVFRLLARSLPSGVYGTHVALNREDGKITSFILYSADSNAKTVRIEYALFPNRTYDEEHDLFEFVHIGALRHHYEAIEIDTETFGGDIEPFVRMGFLPKDGTDGRILRFEPGT